MSQQTGRQPDHFAGAGRTLAGPQSQGSATMTEPNGPEEHERGSTTQRGTGAGDSRDQRYHSSSILPFSEATSADIIFAVTLAPLRSPEADIPTGTSGPLTMHEQVLETLDKSLVG